MASCLALVYALALAALLCGCSSPPKKTERAQRLDHKQQLEVQAAKIVVDASDGISEVEAFKIARDYFTSKSNACGAVGVPLAVDATWRVPIFEGILGLHTHEVTVSKSDGSFSVADIKARFLELFQEVMTRDELVGMFGHQIGFGSVKRAEFSRYGRQALAVWYCPFSGRAASFLHAYYYDPTKDAWILFVDRFVEGTPDLSGELPSDELIFRDVHGKVVVRESIAKLPAEEW
jgi:hypothetical protein